MPGRDEPESVLICLSLHTLLIRSHIAALFMAPWLRATVLGTCQVFNLAAQFSSGSGAGS